MSFLLKSPNIEKQLGHLTAGFRTLKMFGGKFLKVEKNCELARVILIFFHSIWLTIFLLAVQWLFLQKIYHYN